MITRVVRRGALAALALFGLEAVYAVLRPVPRLEDFDPSGEFGDPDLQTLRIAVLGDSSVTAPGVAGPHEIWVSLVCTRLAEDRHVVLQSFAVGGSKAHDVIARQLDDAIDFKPDVVFVSVGANDVIKGVPLRRFESNLNHLIGKLAGTGATVILTGVGVMGTIPRLYPPLSLLLSRRAERFDRVHWRVAEPHGATVIDQRADDPRIWNTEPTLWAADYFHVSAAGHIRWADTVWHTVEPLMNGVREPV